MTMEAGTEDLGASAHREVWLAEFAALGLFVVEGLVILGFLAAAIANQVAIGNNEALVYGTRTWGYTLGIATEWAAPETVAVFLVTPIALVVWAKQRVLGDLSDTRLLLVLRLSLALAALTVLGGIVSVAGHVMASSPSEAWSSFFTTLGLGLGSVVLGSLAIIVIVRLAGDMQLDLFARDDEDDLVEEGEVV